MSRALVAAIFGSSRRFSACHGEVAGPWPSGLALRCHRDCRWQPRGCCPAAAGAKRGARLVLLLRSGRRRPRGMGGSAHVARPRAARQRPRLARRRLPELLVRRMDGDEVRRGRRGRLPLAAAPGPAFGTGSALGLSEVDGRSAEGGLVWQGNCSLLMCSAAPAGRAQQCAPKGANVYFFWLSFLCC